MEGAAPRQVAALLGLHFGGVGCGSCCDTCADQEGGSCMMGGGTWHSSVHHADKTTPRTVSSRLIVAAAAGYSFTGPNVGAAKVGAAGGMALL